ncbi:hypothetical protein ACFUJY_27200 [Streptomyces sp. NPDC057249]|uniref:hypothetical protein n=1 Tax=Streptomyces sp. NPDC057249 TaxID=3346067 RepID=UPI003633D99D
MEASALAAMVVAIMTATATEAAGAVGQGAGNALADALRARLAASERGRTALSTLDRAPDDLAALASARSAIQEEIEADPELSRHLQVQLSAPAHHTTGSMTINGSKVSRSSIALGPLTVNNTRAGRAVIALIAALLVAVVVVAVYGGVELILPDDSPGSSRGGGDRNAVRTLNADELRQVIPDLASMPGDWKRDGSIESGENKKAGCSVAQGKFVSAYGRDSSGTLVRSTFRVWSCSSAAASAKAFEDSRAALADGMDEFPLSELGDQRTAATTHDAAMDETTARAAIRVGTVLIGLEYGPALSSDHEWTAEFEQLATVAADRAQRVQNA